MLVTSAVRSHSDDLAYRERRYIATQSVRVACLVGATVLPLAMWGRGLLIAGAVVLPWMGVVAANAPTIAKRRRSAVVAGGGGELVRLEPGAARAGATVLDQEP